MSRATRTLRILKKTVKLLFVLLIAFINILLIWRIVFSSTLPSSMKALSPNENLLSAYEQDASLNGMFRQEQRTITSGEDNSGYFSVMRSTFIPSANQIQIVVRYNNSTLRHTQEDFSLDEAPSRDDEVYDVSLLVVTDLTPNDDSDNLETDEDSTKEHRILPSYFTSDKKNLYNYRLFVFDLGELDLKDIVNDGSLLAVYADFYYKGEVNYEEEPYGTLCLYDYITEIIPIQPTAADKKALVSAIK